MSSSSKSKKLDEAAQEAMQSELSGSAFFQSTQVGKTTSGQTGKATKLQVDKYTTHLRPETIEAVKNYAFHHKKRDYEIVQLAIDEFLEKHKDE